MARIHARVEETMTADASATAPEIIETGTTRVACNGGGGPLGHPNVWLEMGEATQVQCPYCSRLFVLKSEGSHS